MTSDTFSPKWQQFASQENHNLPKITAQESASGGGEMLREIGHSSKNQAGHQPCYGGNPPDATDPATGFTGFTGHTTTSSSLEKKTEERRKGIDN
jgi:hypothetical protein